MSNTPCKAYNTSTLGLCWVDATQLSMQSSAENNSSNKDSIVVMIDKQATLVYTARVGTQSDNHVLV